MKLKDIDWKQFFIDKGEQIALITAAVIMVLMMVVGLGLKGLGSGSASENQEILTKLTGEAEVKIKNSNPDQAADPITNRPYKEIDPDLAKATNPNLIATADNACNNSWFTVTAFDDSRWRKPTILGPDEFHVETVMALVPSYFLTEDGKSVLVIVPRDPSNAPGLGKGTLFQFVQGLKDRNKKARIPFQGAIPKNPSTSGPGAGFARNQNVGMARSYVADKPKEEAAKKDWETTLIAIDDIDEKTGAKLATVQTPYLMAVVTASFPYRQQLEEFRRALRFSSVTQMLNDPEVNIEFLGFEVQRREIINGKPGEWYDPKIEDEMKRMMVRAIGKEPEDPLLVGSAYPVPVSRLIMRRPKLGRNFKYDEVTSLGSIKDTLDALNAITKAGSKKALPKKSKFDLDPEIFDDKPIGGIQKGGGITPGGENSAKMSQIAPGHENDDPSGMAATTGTTTQPQGDTPIPEKCLIRFVDVNIDPNKVYEYQIKIVTNNPLQDKANRAVELSLTTAKALIPDKFTVVDKKAFVPPTLFYYAVDEKPEKPVRGFLPANQDRVAIQIHRWFDKVPNPSNPKMELPVGDWSIMERTLVQRGEFLGREDKVEIPIWKPAEEAFVIDPIDEKNPRVKPGIKVDFTTEALLVDFEGGSKRPYTVGAKTITDEAPAELLIMTPEGKLLVRSAKADLEEKVRKDRYTTWKRWIEKVKEKPDDKSGKKKETNLFDKK